MKCSCPALVWGVFIGTEMWQRKICRQPFAWFLRSDDFVDEHGWAQFLLDDIFPLKVKPGDSTESVTYVDSSAGPCSNTEWFQNIPNKFLLNILKRFIWTLAWQLPKDTPGQYSTPNPPSATVVTLSVPSDEGCLHLFKALKAPHLTSWPFNVQFWEPLAVCWRTFHQHTCLLCLPNHLVDFEVDSSDLRWTGCWPSFLPQTNLSKSCMAQHSWLLPLRAYNEHDYSGLSVEWAGCEWSALSV